MNEPRKHDIGNQIHRIGHEAYSVALAQPVLERHFTPIYGDDVEKMQDLIGFTLSTIACHDCDPAPLTMEGAVVAVADATDMTKGRGRIAFERGTIDIHSVSALAIESVTIQAGRDQPIEIVVALSNSAGIFQVDQIFARKLIATPLKDYVTIRAIPAADYPVSDQRIIRSVIFDGVQGLIIEHAPDAVAIEESVVGPDARIALSVGQARGAALVAAATAGLECAEYSPTRVKKSVCGHGAADKGQVQRMVKMLLALDELPRTSHEADALAVALCHALMPPLARMAS